MKNAKRILSVVLCLLMSISMLTAIVLPASAAATEVLSNIALNKPITSAQACYAGMGPEKAVDGSTGTRWSAKAASRTDECLTIDLTGKYRLSSFNATLYKGLIASCTLQYCVDGVWTTPEGAEFVVDSAATSISFTFPENTVAEQVRLNIASASDKLGSIYEIVVNGYLVSDNIAKGKTISAKSADLSQYGCAADKAVDGYTDAANSHRWQGAAAAGEENYFVIDLGATYNVESFSLINVTRMEEYEVQYWDGDSFETFYAETTNVGNVTQNVCFYNRKSALGVVQTTKIRFTSTTAAVSIAEIQVFGSLVNATNIAKGKTISAKSADLSQYGCSADKVVDGYLDNNNAHRWQGAAAAGEENYFVIDLGATYYVDYFNLINVTRVGTYTVQYWDGDSFETFYSENTNVGNVYQYADPNKATNICHRKSSLGLVKTEKIRFTSTTVSISIAEFEIYGVRAYDNIALNQSVKGSSDLNATYASAKAVDGVYGANSRWSSNSTPKDQAITFTVNFDGKYYIDAFKLSQFADYAGEYTVDYVDADGATQNLVAATDPSLINEVNVDGIITDKLIFTFKNHVGAVTIDELEVYGYVLVGGVELDAETAVLPIEDTLQLTATVKPAAALNKNVTWASDAEGVATVENGLVTPVSVGTANITVTTEEGEFTATCVVTVTDHKAVIGTTTYETVAKALEAAAENDVIKMLGSDSADYFVLSKNVTLDLNGKTLTAGYLVGFNGTAVIDSKDGGKLVVAKDAVVLDATNDSYLPVYNADGYYTFTTVTLANRTMWNEAEGQYIFAPKFEATANAALAAGADKSAVKVVLRLTWVEVDEVEGGYAATQDFVYDNVFVKKVIESYGYQAQKQEDGSYALAYTGIDDYGYCFDAKLTRTDVDATELAISAVLISDTGVEIASAATPFETAVEA